MAKVVAGYDPDIDPSKAEYKAKPAGIYQLEIKEVEQRDGQKAPQLMVKCEVVGSDHGENVGDNVTLWLSFSPKSTPYQLIPFLDATGIDYEETQIQTPDGGQVPALSFDTDDLIGCVVQAQNKPKNDTYQGVTRLKDSWGRYDVSEMAAPAGGNGQPQEQPQQSAQQNAAPPSRQGNNPHRAGQGAPPPRAAGRRRVGS